MSNKSIACLGQGFVGGSLTTVFNERGTIVYTYDITRRQANGGSWPEENENIPIPSISLENFVAACEKNVDFSKIYFVCLPTPMKIDGSCDLSIVTSVLETLANISGDRIAVIKSTIPPGSTANFNKQFNDKGLYVIFAPEFLTEKNCIEDMRNQDRIILGGPRPYINEVKDVFQTAFPNVPIHKTSSDNAEFVKYVTNTFLTTKVLFANEIYQICEKLSIDGNDVDYDRIIELSTLDVRLGKSHWSVPGPMPADDGSGKLLRGCGGSCFVKDLNALISFAKSIGVTPNLLEAVWDKNLNVRPEKDWEKLIGRAISEKK